MPPLHDFSGVVKFHELRQNASAFREKKSQSMEKKKRFDKNGPRMPAGHGEPRQILPTASKSVGLYLGLSPFGEHVGIAIGVSYNLL